MRPVLLRMEGFASFKDSAVVDFRGADYFALVGPTGAGKSTVIDALIFALFGSVPRWNDQRMISLALAPNVLRGTVALVFDAGGRRYVATRELRRTKTGVGVKNARLERLADPDALADIADDTDSLAADGGTTPAIEELLGLSFENFCQCVVLPQGEFAEFLRAKASDRQKILLKLLGAERYDQIGAHATQIATLSAHKVEVLNTQLTTYAQATDEAEQAAAQRETNLRKLEEKVATATPQLLLAVQTAEAAQEALTTVMEQQATLAAAAVPNGVKELADKQSRAESAATAAAEATTAAEHADTTARRNLAKAPARTPLEKTLEDHKEHATITKLLPELISAADNTAAALEAAELSENRAGSDEDKLRDRALTATATATTSEQAANALARELATLTAVQPPRGINVLAARVSTTAQRASDLATTARVATSAADEAAAQAPAAADRDAVRAAVSLVRTIAGHDADLQQLDGIAREAAAVRQQAAERVLHAQRTLLAAQQQLAAARSANLAAALRPELVPGAPCPVCEQNVHTLPAPLDAPGVASANTAVAAAQAAVTAATDEQASADQALSRVTARREVLTGQRANAASDLATLALPAAIVVPAGSLPSEAALTAVAVTYEDLTAAATRARTRATEATRAAADAAASRELLTGKVTAAVAVLRSARDALVALGAPDLDATDLAAAWDQLTSWAQEQAAARDEQLAAAAAVAAEHAAAATAAQQDLKRATARLAAARTGHLTATSAAQRAAGQAEQARQRLSEINAAIIGAPSEEAVATQLTERDRLEAAPEQAGTALLSARQRQQTAEQAVQRFTDQVEAAWVGLRTARDALVRFGAPEPAAGSLAAAWDGLVTWAHTEAAARVAEVTDLRERLAAGQQRVVANTAAIVDLLAQEGLSTPDGSGAEQLAQAAGRTVGRHIERAAAARHALAADRARAQKLRDEAQTATTREQVARKLGHLLRSNGFPRWLASAALDTLVLDASASLSALSGGQFELTHDKGDFYVVDHADADARRSVRTLSGGETFQASLALALALSSQLGTLGAGSTRLDSIFLDEGFGTLDAATLDTVATTLENLASTDRMVGIVTHVPALAERVPIRFAVSRDERTSRVVREDA